jgi:hypothetical protein
MKKQQFVVRSTAGFEVVEGYVTDDGRYGIDKRKGTCQPNKEFWYLSDVPSGLALDGSGYKTRKAAEAAIEGIEERITQGKLRESDKYKARVEEINEYKKSNGIKETAEEDKKMAKQTRTNTDKVKAMESKVLDASKTIEQQRAEIAQLKAKIKELEKLVKEYGDIIDSLREDEAEPEIKGIDAFDIEGYMATRDNTNRITDELVKAFEETEGLKVERRGKDGWLYITGETEDDTRSRKDIFNALHMRWSGKQGAWFMTPYPVKRNYARA